MQETLFDSKGNPIAYLDFDDDNTFYLWNGTPVAYLSSNNTIYGFNGKHLGWYEKGIIRNLLGEKNGFNKSALGVFPKYEPYKSYKSYKPYKDMKISLIICFCLNLTNNRKIIGRFWVGSHNLGQNCIVAVRCTL